MTSFHYQKVIVDWIFFLPFMTVLDMSTISNNIGFDALLFRLKKKNAPYLLSVIYIKIEVSDLYMEYNCILYCEWFVCVRQCKREMFAHLIRVWENQNMPLRSQNYI